MTMMTIGELIEQGFMRGMQRGAQRFLLLQLRKRFDGKVDAVVEAKLAAASV